MKEDVEIFGKPYKRVEEPKGVDPCKGCAFTDKDGMNGKKECWNAPDCTGIIFVEVKK